MIFIEKSKLRARWLCLSVQLFLTLSCYRNTAEPEIHLIPENYQGPVVILFNDSTPSPLSYEGKFRLYKIPDSGILRTRARPNTGIIEYNLMQFYYLGENGTRSRIPIVMTPNTKLEEATYIHSIRYSVDHESYIVSNPENLKRYSYKREAVVDSLLRAINRHLGALKRPQE